MIFNFVHKDNVVDKIDEQLLTENVRCLSHAEIIILKAIWNNKTYSKIAKEDGLPMNTVLDITQDDLGFMWFAPDQGIPIFLISELCFKWTPKNLIPTFVNCCLLAFQLP